MKINSNNIILLFIIIGLVFVAYGLGQNSKKCPEPTVLYKYIPRDFNIDSTSPDVITRTFKDMFEKSEPYIVNIGNDNLRKIKG